MRIIFVCGEYPPSPHGGIGTFVHTLAHGMRKKGHEIVVVGLGDRDRHWVDEGIDVFILRSVKIAYVGNILSRLRLRSWLRDRVRHGKVDVIETPDFLGMLPFGVPGCPVIVRLHLSATCIYLHRAENAPIGLMLYEELTLKMNSAWIAVSNYMRASTSEVFGIQPSKVKTIYNPVPTAESQSLEVTQLPSNFLLFAGQVSKRKGAVALAEAARKLMKAQAGLHLVYAGGHISAGNGVPIAEQILTALGPELADRVHFLGHVPHSQVLECMKKAMVYVFPSRLEAFGLVILEAMSCGTPVVCSKYPPGPEIVTDGIDGLLADPTSPSDLAEKISRILHSPELAQSLASNAKTTVERFTVERCVSETEAFYRECCSPHAYEGRSFLKQLFLTLFKRIRRQDGQKIQFLQSYEKHQVVLGTPNGFRDDITKPERLRI